MRTSVVVVVFLVSVVVDRSSTIELNIEIAEELPVGTVVADLAAGAGLDVGRDAKPEFTMVYGSFSRYFRLAADSEGTSTRHGHLLVVDRVLDRDVVCQHQSVAALFLQTFCLLYPPSERSERRDTVTLAVRL